MEHFDPAVSDECLRRLQTYVQGQGGKGWPGVIALYNGVLDLPDGLFTQKW